MGSVPTTVSIDSGAQRRVVEEQIASGAYATADEVIQAGLRALEREEGDRNAWLIELAEGSLADPNSTVPAEQVFRELRVRYGRAPVESAPWSDTRCCFFQNRLPTWIRSTSRLQRKQALKQLTATSSESSGYVYLSHRFLSAVQQSREDCPGCGRWDSNVKLR